MRRVLPVAILAVAALAGCGQSNPELIPQSNADALTQTADKIDAACGKQDRSEARAQVRLIRREIDALPRKVNARLKENLQAWVEQIESRIPVDCKDEATPTPTPTETETPTDTPAPTDTPTQAPTKAPPQTPPPAATETAAPTEAPTDVPSAVPTTTPVPAP